MPSAMMNRRFMRMNVLLFECKTPLCPNSLVRVIHHENLNPKISVAMGIYIRASRLFGGPLPAHRGQAATHAPTSDPEDKDKYDLKRGIGIQKGCHTDDLGQQEGDDLNRSRHSEHFFRCHSNRSGSVADESMRKRSNLSARIINRLLTRDTE